MTRKVTKRTASWLPPDWEKSDAYALQALNRGDATVDQQRRALKWIIEQAAATYDMSYRPESQRDTDFALGRAFVGQQIVKLLKLNLALIKGE